MNKRAETGMKESPLAPGCSSLGLQMEKQASRWLHCHKEVKVMQKCVVAEFGQVRMLLKYLQNRVATAMLSGPYCL